ncbi:hypothetical protein D1643_06180 [Enterorhabdus sp. P55]|nr:hypothetical protein [Enterorhabdus sp. P55]
MCAGTYAAGRRKRPPATVGAYRTDNQCQFRAKKRQRATSTSRGAAQAPPLSRRAGGEPAPRPGRARRPPRAGRPGRAQRTPPPSGERASR